MKRIPLFLCALTALGVGLAACAPATGNPIDLATALAQPTEVASTVATTPSPTKTPIPATSTPEATATPEVHMTLEDWKKVFSGPYVGPDHETRDLSLIFDPRASLILTDSEQIKSYPVGTPFAILKTDGTIQIIATPDEASLEFDKGATILTRSDGVTDPASYAYISMAAASIAHKNGNNDIHIKFGELPEGTYANIYRTDVNIALIPENSSFVIDMPKHFEVAYESDPFNSLTLEEAGLENLDPAKWIEQIKQAGYTRIIIHSGTY